MGVRTAVDTAAARRRLEVMLADLDRSMALLRGERTAVAGARLEAHPADVGAHLSDAEQADAALERLRRQRNSVLAALQRIAAGTYGRCVTCGKPIAAGRLEARPDAARCLTCQARYDRARR
ncbi:MULTISPECIES: TraR/DksA family transcriptional regulator [Thermomonospora]|uniref:Transcriptional regulator, TraR/DksA family n=1 Tax=Thermomonospora curvata (strain ATCC 19995 / DSM 43183 / JCM 3096 / KCTC 9072 / NBRC 15933 / NCIMB 10081 / Henssen B9) TaxID=471852 RepID=D1ACI4_THECD|nr:MULTISPECIES: TraR/DksA C4-type zinc finger protein [Thermomonospora]ACY99243.1 transcriptional regulator, TraR/DksA family [Thermomonospora curvata DSM 43183]PKK12307.1 MAG: conjugal transfer protein TraR [Thermomonospora sp. CIF 1]